MRSEQLCWTSDRHWDHDSRYPDAGLVLIFGSTDRLGHARLAELRARYPRAILFGCSTAGEILDTRVQDDTLTATAIRFDATEVRVASETVVDPSHSAVAGRALAARLPAEGLRHVLLLSDGLHVNGTELVAGVKAGLPADVEVTGGLSGDGTRFQRTAVIADAAPAENLIAALGFYGRRLQVGYGSLGGWDAFGPDRLITRSRGNVLYELDGRSALGLYKTYLGEHAAGLPATGLLFPLAVHARDAGDGSGLVRTILAVDDVEQSLTFAGDVPEGQYARLMKANFDRLVDGAAGAASAATQGLRGKPAELALLISCVGRKLVLKQRVEDEVEGVREVLGGATALAGFYSYGEISPYAVTGRCELHNQTMTITTFAEA